MRLMETRTYVEGDTKIKGVPFTRHMVIDKHGNVQEIQADRHQRDWQEFEFERGAIIVNAEPIADRDVPNGRGGFHAISLATVARRLEDYKDEIEKRRAANLREIEINRANSPESRGKSKAARAVSEAMAEALKGMNGGGAMGAELLAELRAMREQNATLAAKVAELEAKTGPQAMTVAVSPPAAPEPRRK